MTRPAEVQNLRQPQADTVAMLEDLLEDARAGRLVGFAFAAETVGQHIATGYAGVHDMWRVVGAMRELERRILSEYAD